MTIASRWLSSPPAETHDGCPNTEITIIGRIAVPPILAQKCILCVYHPAGFSRKGGSERAATGPFSHPCRAFSA